MCFVASWNGENLPNKIFVLGQVSENYFAACALSVVTEREFFETKS